jgi:hypothetical protein
LIASASIKEETRAELAGERPKGMTQRYQPIAPAIVAALITGLRVSHLLELEWSQVNSILGST